MNIGVLALQGDFVEHLAMLRSLGIDAREVRLPSHLDGLHGLIIPGGESTTIGKLAVTYELIEPLRAFAEEHAIWGTCAGAIFIAKEVHRDQPLLGLMNITIERNAFGRQVDSFIAELRVPALEEPERPFRAVFIRAPIIESIGENVSVIAELSNGNNPIIVSARQDRFFATSFHPELTEDDRFHRYFLEMVEE